MPLVKPGKWAYAYSRRGLQFDEFVAQYFSSIPRGTVVICGAGFDPRASVIPSSIAASGSNVDAWLLREERPAPTPRNIERADRATEDLRGRFRQAQIVRFNVFDEDGALAVPSTLLARAPLSDLHRYDDVVLDLSSLSLGVAYPLAKWLYERAIAGEFKNLHLMVTAAPGVDRLIQASYDANVQSPRGFFRPSLSDRPAAVMWVPQLQQGLSEILERIGGDFDAADICPIVPFPTREVREPEQLFVEYERLLNNVWGVDPRDVIYAAENDPLDVYRILVRIARERREVFAELGPSEVVLTPMGSKVVALGALMAALEENLSVRYVEARDYEGQDFPCDQEYEKISVWLHGGPRWNPEANS